jgi:hypothetical protein
MAELASFTSEVLVPDDGWSGFGLFCLEGGDYLTRDRHGRARADTDGTVPSAERAG